MLRMPVMTLVSTLLAACATVPGNEAASPQSGETEQVREGAEPVTRPREEMIPGGEVRGGPQPATLPAATPTRILDEAMAERLLENSGISLQWIGWERRGQADVTIDDTGTWWLSASQRALDARGGEVTVRGMITEIGADYFLLQGPITITDTPGAGRNCRADKTWRFAITQDRKYWRLREFEWCDRLTDYIDIYF